MKLNRRAGGGFMEAMAALMICTLALSAFMGVIAYTHSVNAPEPDVSTAFLQRLSIEDGRITGIDKGTVEDECARNGYESMAVVIEAHDLGRTLKLRVGGSVPDTNITVERGTMLLETDAGTRLSAVYEVAVFWI